MDGNQGLAQALTHISLSIDSDTKAVIELAREAISLVLEPPHNRVHAKLNQSVQWPNDQLIEQERDDDRRVYCYIRWEVERQKERRLGEERRGGCQESKEMY